MNSLLAELKTIISDLGVFVVTGTFGSGLYDIPNKNEYVVMIPTGYDLELYADNEPCEEAQEVRVSLFCRDDFLPIIRRLTVALLKAGIAVTDRHYAGWESGARYHHYVIDTVKSYYFDLEEA